MRRTLGRLSRLPRTLAGRIFRSFRQRRCRCGAWIAGTSLSINQGTRFNVPVIVNGAGGVSIGAQNSFGYTLAPMIGNGAILIQARTANASIRIGQRNHTSNNISIIARESIEIGNDCQIGDLVAIYDSDFHEVSPATRNASAGKSAPVLIENNVFLGSRVLVLKGVRIGENTVVAPMSVVTKSLPSNCLAAGIPARVIRQIA